MIDIKLCCGCGACKSVCPKEAIQMECNQEGFSYPVIDTMKCVDCGICEKVCPMISKQVDNGNEHKRYAAKCVEMDTRLRSTSGGAFTVFSDYILQNGGEVYACSFDEDFVARYTRACTDAERDNQRGAKYVQSDLNGAYEQISQSLEAERTVLFVGPPCYAQGLRNYLDIHKKSCGGGQCLIIDTVCHGVPSPQIWNDHVRLLKTNYGNDIQQVSFRDKKLAWRGAQPSIMLSNGERIVKRRDLSAYTDLYFGGYITRPDCHNCPYANLNRPGDITIGDCWGIEDSHPEFDDKKGISLIILNSELGKEVFEKTSNKFELIELHGGECIQPQLRKPSNPSVNRSQFWKAYASGGYKKAIKKVTKYGKIFYLKSSFKILIAKIQTHK